MMKKESIPWFLFCLTALVSIFLVCVAYPRAQEPVSSPLAEAQIREVASRLLHDADKANCKPRGCRILVADFTLASGLTSQLGIQLADQFSKELASRQNGIGVVDRSVLHAYLEQERIPPDLLTSDKAIRWLGKELHSTAVLMGTTQTEGSLVRVQANFLSCYKEKLRPTGVFTLPLPDSKTALSGYDPFMKTPGLADSLLDPAVHRAGVAGVTTPTCMHCPPPDYTSDGRAAKFQGAAVLNVVVSSEGKVTSARIIHGIPFGLNEMALDAVRQWKFRPATFQGNPVAAAVPIEISFRLF